MAGLALAHISCGASGRYGVTGGGSNPPPTPGQPPTPTTSGIATVSFIIPAKSPGNTPVNVGDSVLLQFRASSAKRVATVDLKGVAQRGSVNLGTDTTIPRYTEKLVHVANGTTDTILNRFIYAIPGDSTAETVFIIATVTDSAGNTGADTTTIHVAPGPHVVITSPIAQPGTPNVAAPGKSVTVSLHVTSALGARIIGWQAAGAAPLGTARDSTVYGPSGLPKDTVRSTTLTIPAAQPNGVVVLTAFAVDSAGNPSGGVVPDTITVQSAAGDVTPPRITFSIVPRLEVDDSITIHATDPSGVAKIGFVVRSVSDTTRIWARDSVSFVGSQTDITQTFAVGHPAPAVNRGLDTITAFAQLLTIEAFAVDSVGNRGLSSSNGTPISATGGTAFKDTVTVVAGKTYALPAGGFIADAIYSKNRNQVYLSNQALNRLEVFDVATATFKAGGIPVGSKPLALALWPRDTLGAYADTVVVANSGGTNLSIVDVASQAEVRRQRLPNYQIQGIHTEPSGAGGISIVIVSFDLSDRPFNVGTVCITAGAATCDHVRAVYSSTPTNAQNCPGRGYIAWVDLNNGTAGPPHNHFMYEHAQLDFDNDTLQVVAAFDSLPNQSLRDTILGAGVGIRAGAFLNGDICTSLLFKDSTFVRNSGDFQHGLFGEGGNVGFARAITYDRRSGLQALAGTTCRIPDGIGGFVPLNCVGTLDKGVSPAIYVADFISNRASKVNAIAMNFNGRTNFVRADSIYVTDFNVRQQGIIQVGGQNAGMDVNPNNNFDAANRGSPALNANNRLLYAARPDANIEVFDTYFYGSVALIPVRDPIIGPVRLALNSLGQQVLVGVTAFGVVVVPFTPPANIFPIRAGFTAGGGR